MSSTPSGLVRGAWTILNAISVHPGNLGGKAIDVHFTPCQIADLRRCISVGEALDGEKAAHAVAKGFPAMKGFMPYEPYGQNGPYMVFGPLHIYRKQT